jgi:hypothetical protein
MFRQSQDSDSARSVQCGRGGKLSRVVLMVDKDGRRHEYSVARGESLGGEGSGAVGLVGVLLGYGLGSHCPDLAVSCREKSGFAR